jgi:hypothetical protein
MATPNRPASQNKYTPQNMQNSSFDEDYGVNAVENLVFDPNAGLLRAYPANALNLKPWDYVSRSLDTATETWTFKSGGAGGTTTNTVVIVYTDGTLETISTVTKT